LCTLVFWAFQPLVDHVPVGVDYNRKNPQEIAVRVECNTLFGSAARADSPLPTLPVQPTRVPPLPPLAYAYVPCSRTHREARVLFVVDTVVAVGVMSVAVWLVVRRFGVAALRPSLARR
jgi:hypothetical protein